VATSKRLVVETLREEYSKSIPKLVKRGMACEQKSFLLNAYKIATTAYSRAVRELQKNIGITERGAYQDLRKIVDDARLQSERSRLELEQHVRFHDC
jgi:hypothetical protein